MFAMRHETGQETVTNQSDKIARQRCFASLLWLVNM
jgi:hypothetical protein